MDITGKMTDAGYDKRCEPRYTIDKYYSVEFLINGLGCMYQCKLWNISKKGMCIVVKKNSPVLMHFKVGDILNMRYYEEGMNIPTQYIKTQIRHITPDNTGRFKKHYMVGLMLMEGEHLIPIPLKE